MWGPLDQGKEKFCRLARVIPQKVFHLRKVPVQGAPSKGHESFVFRLPGRCLAVLSCLSFRCGSIAAGFMDLLYPPSCICCESYQLDHEGMDWCEGCLNRLPWIGTPLCTGCGKPYHKSPSSVDHLCGECIQDVFHFDFARSSFYHEGLIKESLHAIKFGSELHLVRPVAQLLAKTVQEWRRAGFDLLIPVPLHPRRLGQRGFNQSALLARFLSSSLSTPLDLAILKRTQWTVPQTRLSREERLSNVKNAFCVEHSRRLKGKRVLLVDDVFTTGSTLSECAGVLKTSGAQEVSAVTVSRAIWEHGVHYGSKGQGSGLGENARL